ncbi:hypothetical protein AMTR_s00044p00169670 [Amborella trichopoda]|uniref:Pentatricopeptide repeat-containing protein n=2 Tax=Amborella trichopoda TaxID=13333 RepID=U5DA01_AMBTC|nr:hypothetical protein AMTR_s00044p00169670 [Amborella trichopoda]
MDSAFSLFNCIENRDSVSWNIVIQGCINHDSFMKAVFMFSVMRASGLSSTVPTMVLLFQAYGHLGAIQEATGAHSLMIRTGFSDIVSIQNSLLNVYARAGELQLALRLFDEMDQRDVITWSIIINGHARNHHPGIALCFFKEMHNWGGIKPDGLTIVTVLQACAAMEDTYPLLVLHSYIIKLGFRTDVFVNNTLIDLYSRCGDTQSARRVLDYMPERNNVTWNSIITGLVQNEHYIEALLFFNHMQKDGIEADEVTMVNLLQVIKRFGDSKKCKSIHSVIIRRGLEVNMLLSNSVMDAYAKCGSLELAWRLFTKTNDRDLVSWSTIIANFSDCGRHKEALSLFREMYISQEKPNSVTMLSILDSCASLAALLGGKWAHGLVIRNRLEREVTVSTSLVNMYAKCGDTVMARRVFDSSPNKNVVTWSSMIGAYGMNGHARAALELFKEMESYNMKPNEITYLSVLSACSHGGLVEEGRACFERMGQDPRVKPSVEHYACMVDLLGRAGHLEAAQRVIGKMHNEIKAGPSAWGALLSACRIHGNTELGGEVVQKVIELEPSSSGGYLLASSMYAAANMWSDVAKMRSVVNEKGLRVMGGYSLIQVNLQSHRFIAWDWSHPQSQLIHETLEHLMGEMKWGVDVEFM